jgi:hypothetical protein
MSEGTVVYNVKKMGKQSDVHDGEWSGWQSVVSDGLVQSVNQSILERRRFTNSDVSCEFLQISCTVLYKIITVRPG